jgi:hypothetical protein
MKIHMKKPVVKIPLIHKSFLINIEPPCLYCGKPIPENTEKWQKKITYQMKYWGRTKKFGNWDLGDLVDANGNKKLGEIIINISYCPDHLPIPSAIKKIRILRTVLSILLPVILLAGFLWLFFINDSTKYSGENSLLWLIIISPATIFLGIFLAACIAEFSKWWVSRSQIALKDFELDGHWGVHSIFTEINQGEIGIGPITYQLQMTCSNLEIAERFKDAYPHANID